MAAAALARLPGAAATALTSTILLVSLALNLSLLSSAWSPPSIYRTPGCGNCSWELGSQSGRPKGKALRWLRPLLREIQAGRSNLGRSWLRLGDLFGSAHVVCSYVRLWEGRPLPRLARLPPTVGALLILAVGSRAWLNRACVSPSCARLRWFDQLSALSLALAAAVSHPHARGDHTKHPGPLTCWLQ